MARPTSITFARDLAGHGCWRAPARLLATRAIPPASHTGTPAWLVNPAVIGRTIEPTFPEGLGAHRPEVHVLFGRQDDLIDPHQAAEWLERNGFSVTATWVDEGHRIEPPAFKAWIDQIL